MDLWDMFAGLWRQKVGLALVLITSLALGALGWMNTNPSYSVTSAQALRAVEETEDGRRATTGSFELGMIGTMMVQNLSARQATFGGAVVNATNSVVSPPAALPLVTITVTSDSEQVARDAMSSAKKVNEEFLDSLLPADSGTSVSLVDMPGDDTPVESQRPRIRSAGIGAIFGGLAGLTLLLIWTAVRQRRHREHGGSVSGR